MLKSLLPGAFIALVLTAMPAFAHVGQGHAVTFAAGFFHPLSGIDHVLAMVAVGLYAASLGGAGIALVPLAFAVTMIGGGVAGYSGFSMPYVEQVIGLSVVVMSLVIALGVRLPLVLAMALVGTFALFHGHAHGSEGDTITSFITYAAGFVAATALLHVAGIVIGRALDSLGPKPSARMHRYAGAIGALTGVSLLTGWVTV